MSERSIEDYSLSEKIAKLVAKYSSVNCTFENGKASFRGSINIARLIDEALLNETVECEQSENSEESKVQLLDGDTASCTV